jgi:hypothetical protein
MHPAKRRRLEQTQITLNKPFRSPLRTTTKVVGDESSFTSNSSNLPGTTAPALHHASPAQTSSPSLASISWEGQSQYALLTHKLNKLRQSLDTAEQALQIVTSDQDNQLEALVTKWKSVARDAADELFIDAKARIDEMGGLEAWQRKVRDDKLLCAEDNDYDRSVEARLSHPQAQVVDQVSSERQHPLCALIY